MPVNGGTPTTVIGFNSYNGSGASGDLTLVGNTLYGTTSGGGAYSYGNVYSVGLVPEPGTWVTLALGIVSSGVACHRCLRNARFRESSVI